MTAERPQSTRAQVLIPFGLVVLIWGSTWVVIRDQLGTVPPSWSVAYRFLLAGCAMLAVARWRGDSLRLDRRGWLFAAGLGVSQFACSFNFVYRGGLHITSGLVAVIFALLLVPNAVLARIFLGQRMGRQLLVGSAAALAGIGLLILHEARVDPNGGREVMLGVGFTLLGVMTSSVANVMQGTETSRAYPMATMLAMAMLIGGVIDASFALVTAGPPVGEMRLGYWLGILYLSLFSSAIAFTLYFGVIRTIGPAKAAYNGVLVPIVAMTLSTLIEGYRWTPVAAGGAVLALAGLVIALTARRPAR